MHLPRFQLKPLKSPSRARHFLLKEGGLRGAIIYVLYTTNLPRLTTANDEAVLTLLTNLAPASYLKKI